MSTTAVASKARPLSKLAPMIRRELKAGFQAGERHWKKAGRLLNEARQHFTRDGKPNSGKGPGWIEWVAKEFTHPWTGEPLKAATARTWMLASKRIANGDERALPPASSRNPTLNAVRDSRSPGHENYNPKLDWKSGVREVQQKINVKQLEKQWQDQKREKQQRAALARKIVDAGYRALAPVVHPDRQGGSAEAMAKLTDARKWIDELIRSYS